MATGNFHNENARKIYAFCMGYENEETGEYIESDDLDYDFALDGIKSELRDEIKKTDFYEKELNKISSLYSYPSQAIITIAKDICIGDVWGRIEITAITRSGYYEGCYFDWEMLINLENNTYDSNDDINMEEWKDSIYYSDMNNGLKSMLYTHFKKRLDSAKESLINLIENVFEKNSIGLIVSNKFSNGEIFYSKI